jgi:cation/acetate symporter
MAAPMNRRLINPRLGIYFSIFASSFTGLVVLMLIFEQLGSAPGLIRLAMFAAPLAMYAVIAGVIHCHEPIEFFAAGRRVPAVYAGLILAGSAIGGTGIIAFTGLFFINGHDTWCIAVGISAGFVVMALMIAPYMRKLGAFTVPSYLGRRFDSRGLRLVSAAILAPATLLVVIAELKIGALAAHWLIGYSQSSMTLALGAFAVLTVAVGGMRSLTWTNVAQTIAALLAMMVPVAIVAAMVTNLPLPQLSHGPVLRAIGRMESIQGVPIAIAPAFAFELAGQGLVPLANRIAAPYASVGPLGFILGSLSIMFGIAGAPWLLPRLSTTPGIYETRKAIGWATVLAGLVLLTGASIAVLMRDIVMDQLVEKAPSDLPQWFLTLVEAGVARADTGVTRLSLGNLSFERDAILFMLPAAAGFPPVIVYMALAGAVAASLAAASSAIAALGFMLAEDGMNGLMWEPPPSALALAAARIGVAVAGGVAAFMAAVLASDPVTLVLWALGISASAVFPVLAMSVWWKRLNAFGAIASMITGFTVAVIAILADETVSFGVPSELVAVIGVPAAVLIGIICARMSPAPGRHVLEIVRDIRLPGGETMYDRDMRLARLKRRTPV